MAAHPSIRNSAAASGLDAILAHLNDGAGAGHVKIFNGTLPSGPNAADAGTLLATMTLSDPAFGAATNTGTGGVIATAGAITGETSAPATGTAVYCRGYDSNNVCIIQGTVGTSAADFIINSTSIVAGDTVSCTSWTVTLPDGS